MAIAKRQDCTMQLQYRQPLLDGRVGFCIRGVGVVTMTPIGYDNRAVIERRIIAKQRFHA